ncbi:VOC family protein [Ligilactobacillus sp.]|uniref:VOC family protein n=1 Tax=Ligilactobacillus sp. TaxID=2767921 RepID=UPI002FE3AED5
MKIKRIDHIVLPVSNLEASTRFYHETFDMPLIREQSDDSVHTLRCGHQLIRLVESEKLESRSRKASVTIPGACDLCIVSGDRMSDIVNHLKSYFIEIIEGPVERHGSEGRMESIYIHDLDSNLIEISVYENK